MEFCVKVPALDDSAEDKARWVLEVDSAKDRLLIAHDDGSLHWHSMSACTFGWAQNPGMPQLVMPVPPPKSGIVTPAGAMPNRAERRRTERNGGG